MKKSNKKLKKLKKETKKTKSILKVVGSNLLSFVIGAILGFIILIAFFIGPLLTKASEKAGLAIIGLAPVLIILYGAISTIIGGILGIILFNLYKYFNKKRKINLKGKLAVKKPQVSYK